MVPLLVVVKKVFETLVRFFPHLGRRDMKRHQNVRKTENVVSDPLGYTKRKQWVCSKLKLKAHGSFGPGHVPNLACCLQNLAHFAPGQLVGKYKVGSWGAVFAEFNPQSAPKFCIGSLARF